MKTLVVANQKGGVSKTTTTAHLAVAAAGEGKRTCIIDADPQGSLSDWWNDRAAEDIQLLQCKVHEISSIVGRLADQFDLLVIDTPPGTGAEVAGLVRLGDFVLIPVRPSPHDLRAVPGTLSLLDGQPFAFVLSQAKGRASITLQAVAALSEHGTVARAVIGDRVDFASAMIDGRTVGEIDPRGKAAEEVAALWTWVRDRLWIKETKKKKVEV